MSLVADGAVLIQSGGEVTLGGSAVGGGVIACLGTVLEAGGVGCLAVAPAVAAGTGLIAHGTITAAEAAKAWNRNYGVLQARVQSRGGGSRFDALARDPQTGQHTAGSESEAESILQAEKQGIVSGARRPNLKAGEPNLDFIVDGGYADIKTPVDPTKRSLSAQANDIGTRIKQYDSNVKTIVDLKNLTTEHKSAFKSDLTSVVTNMRNVAFLNDQ